MSNARSALRAVVDEFRNYGISNEVRIAEHVAFMLLILDQWEEFEREVNWGYDYTYRFQSWLNDRHRELVQQTGLPLPVPPSVSQWGEHPSSLISHVINALMAALTVSPHNRTRGIFFQHEVRFELLKATSGSQYPTPHHVAMLMAQLAVTDETLNVLDPTAGTAGLLVAAHQQNPNTKLVGVDFDSQWVGLASANLILNNATNAEMKTEQATNLYHHPEYAGRFDSVLMNPPFGGSRSPNDAWAVGSGILGRTTSTLLAALALHMLKPHGFAAFLQPSGTLFGGGGEARLRRVLTSEYQLEAVITLPLDAMQPYSQVATHLIVIRKAQPSDAVWFVSLTSDGYPGGASRDLTADPIFVQDEFPRARDLILATRANTWTTCLKMDGIGEFQTVKLVQELPGLGVRRIGETQAIKWVVSDLTDGILVEVQDAARELKGWFYESYTETASPTFTVDQVHPFNWEEQFRRNDWERGIAESWQSNSGDMELTVNNRGKAFVFNGYSFGPRKQNRPSDINAMACLFNAEGRPLTPWLTISDDSQQRKVIAEKFGQEVSAIGIKDGLGKRIGWLIELTAKQNELEQQAVLLIVFNSQCDLFGDTDGRTYTLLDGGWLEISAAGRLNSKRGAQVRLRDDVAVEGFAVGPVPISEGTNSGLFGVLVPQTAFVDGDRVGDMRPSRFLPEPEAVPLGHPLDVLASIRRSQTQLSTKVDSLLGILGQSSGYDETSEAPAEIPEWIETMLSSQQRKLLDLLRAKRAEQRPRHFNEIDVEKWCEEASIHDKDKKPFTADAIQQQIHLFVRLGLVKAVHISGQNQYRMITRGDLVQEMEDVQ